MASKMGKREKAIYNQIDKINSRLEAIANRFGLESSIYNEYLNKVKAVFPEKNQTRVIKNKAGNDVIQIRNIKANRTDAKGNHDFAEALRLPTVTKYEQEIKRQIAKERGAITFGEQERMARTITKEEVNQFVSAKDLVYSYMDGGKIKYDTDIVGALLGQKGNKTYEELAEILKAWEGGETNAQVQTDENAGAVEAGYEKGRVTIT